MVGFPEYNPVSSGKKIIGNTAETLKPDVVTDLRLELLRHGEKEICMDGESDCQIKLTPLGRIQAICKGLELSQSEALAGGSFNDRARQAAGIMAVANEIAQDLGVGYDTLKNLRDKLMNRTDLSIDERALLARSNELMSLENVETRFADKFDTKNIQWISEDERLDFNFIDTIYNESEVAYDNDTFMQYKLNDSDRRAVGLGDDISVAYTVFAARVAEFVKDYIEVGAETRELVAKDSQKFEKIKQDDVYRFDRFFGTHAGIQESFLLKVLEVLEQEEKVPVGTRDEIISKIGGMFKETEGLRFDIRNSEKGQTILMTLPERIGAEIPPIEISVSILDEIIRQNQELKEKIQKTKAEKAIGA